MFVHAQCYQPSWLPTDWQRRLTLVRNAGECSISVLSRRVPPASKCLDCLPEKGIHFKGLQAVHYIGVVIRFREYGAGENDFGCLAPEQVFSATRITLEYNGKIRPQPDRENAFAGSNGGDEGISYSNLPM